MREIRAYLGTGALILLAGYALVEAIVPPLALGEGLEALVAVGRLLGLLWLGLCAAVLALAVCLVALAWLVSATWLDRVRVWWLFTRGRRW